MTKKEVKLTPCSHTICSGAAIKCIETGTAPTAGIKGLRFNDSTGATGILRILPQTEKDQDCVYEPTAPMGRPRKDALPVPRVPIENKAPIRATKMSRAALQAACGEAERPKPLQDSTDLLVNGVQKLRLDPNLKSTFSHFEKDTVGGIAQSYYTLVSSSESSTLENQPRTTYRAPQGTRFLYELAIQAQKATRKKTVFSHRLAQDADSHNLWQRYPSDIISLATAGIPSGFEENIEEPLFIRLLREDESLPFDYPPQHTFPFNPLDSLSVIQRDHLLALWFTQSPLSFLINDALFLAAVRDGTAEPALTSLLIGMALVRATAASASSSPGPPNLAFIDPKPFFAFGSQRLLAKSAEEAASSLQIVQALVIYGTFLGAAHKTRQSWGLLSTGSTVAREQIKRLRAKPSSESDTAMALKEDLHQSMWMLAVLGGWSFLSLGLPKTSLIDLIDDLPLPAVTESRSHALRLTLPHISDSTPGRQRAMAGFSETCRALSAVVSTVVPDRTQGFPNNDISIPQHLLLAHWLLLRTHESPGTSQTAFLRCAYAILALHRLAPFNEACGADVLSSSALPLAIQSMEVIVETSVPQVRQAIDDGFANFLPVSAKSGVLRLVSDSLPHCLRLLDHLAAAADSSSEVYHYLFTEQSRIGALVENFVFLQKSGITAAAQDTTLGARRVTASLASMRAKSESLKRPLTPPSPPPIVQIPSVPKLPPVHHFKSLSSGRSVPDLKHSTSRHRSARSLSSTTSRHRSNSSLSSYKLPEVPPLPFDRIRNDSITSMLSIQSASSSSSVPSLFSSQAEPSTARTSGRFSMYAAELDLAACDQAVESISPREEWDANRASFPPFDAMLSLEDFTFSFK